MKNLHCHMHKGFSLICTPKRTAQGRFMATVAVTYLGSERTRSQRFLDLTEEYETEEEAVERGRKAGVEWVDKHLNAQ
jgi:hypothetical protein